MAKIKGKDLKIEFEDYTVACARSCELTIENETIEIASPSSGQFKEYIKGRTGWSISVSGLVGTGDDFSLLSLINEVSLTAMFYLGSNSVSGDCICTQIKYTGTIGNLAQYSATFQGSGEIS